MNEWTHQALARQMSSLKYYAHRAVQLSSDRGLHGLQLHMIFVVFMDEGCLVCYAK